MAYLTNSTFENGQAGWAAINGANQVTTQIVSDGTARSGASFLRARVEEPGCSVGTDFFMTIWNQYPDQFEFGATNSVGVIAYVRAAPGGPPISGQLKLWSLGLESGPQNNNGTNFTVGSDWTMLACALDGTNYQYLRNRNIYGHPQIRVEFYINTVDAYFDIDTVLAY